MAIMLAEILSEDHKMSVAKDIQPNFLKMTLKLHVFGVFLSILRQKHAKKMLSLML